MRQHTAGILCVREIYSNGSHFIAQGRHNIVRLLGLVKAANTFDSERGTKFSTYAALCIRNEMLMYMRKVRRYFGKEISLEEPVSTDETGTVLTIADTIEANENPQDECLAGIMFAEFQRRLSTLDRSVLKMKMEGYRKKKLRGAWAIHRGI